MWLNEYLQDVQIKEQKKNPIRALEHLFFEGDSSILFSDDGIFRVEPTGRLISVENYYSVPFDLDEAIMLASIGPLYGDGDTLDDSILNDIDFILKDSDLTNSEWLYQKIDELDVLNTHLLVHFNTLTFIKNIKDEYLLKVLKAICNEYIRHLNEHIAGKPIKNLCPSCSEKNVRKEYIKTVQILNRILEYIGTTLNK